MKVKIIVAVTENDAIGRNGELLFHFKEDLKNFKKLTSGNIVLMGRKTYESIGKPLPNRTNIVLTRNVNNDNTNNVIYKKSLEEALRYAKDISNGRDLYIIGGGQLYKEALEKDIVDEVILTRIKTKVDNVDTFFPKLDYTNKWSVDRVESYSEGYGKDYDICYISKRNKENL